MNLSDPIKINSIFKNENLSHFFGRREGKSGGTSLFLRLRWDGDAQY